MSAAPLGFCGFARGSTWVRVESKTHLVVPVVPGLGSLSDLPTLPDSKPFQTTKRDHPGLAPATQQPPKEAFQQADQEPRVFPATLPGLLCKLSRCSHGTSLPRGFPTNSQATDKGRPNSFPQAISSSFGFKHARAPSQPQLLQPPEPPHSLSGVLLMTRSPSQPLPRTSP